jgi:DNA-binding response OmpR family regulator
MAKMILIVEDDESIRESLASMLQLQGYAVLLAENGADGLAAAQKKHPDLVVLDLMMPKMNGYEVCASIQGDEKLKDIPVIMTTALTSDEKSEVDDAAWRERLDVALFVSKPYSPGELTEKIEEILRNTD